MSELLDLIAKHGTLTLTPDDLSPEALGLVGHTYKLLCTYCSLRLKLLHLQAEHCFEVVGGLSIRAEPRLPLKVFQQARGLLVGMGRVYNELPVWCQWEKVWRVCEDCGREGTVRPCPLREGIGERVLVVLCDGCAAAREGDVWA